MTYNVQNLFDAINDPAKNDESYLPLSVKNQIEGHVDNCIKILGSELPENPAELQKEIKRRKGHPWVRECLAMDWNDEVIEKKLKRLAAVIRSVNDGAGPDILFLQEIENKEVVERLRLNHLSDLGYQETLHQEGDDARGIDIAILTKLKIRGGVELEKTDFSESNPEKIADTREITGAQVQLPNGDTVNLFGVHMPGQHLENPEMRVEQIEHLAKLQRTGRYNRNPSIAAGDFNISAPEDKKSQLYEMIGKNWGVSHLMGCDDCEGTYYWRGENQWSMFDAILVTQNLKKYVDTDSIKIIKGLPNQTWSSNGGPRKFNPYNFSGTSDHFPLVMDLVFPEADDLEAQINRRKWIGRRDKVKGKKVKVAFYDADSTLRVTKSGKFSNDYAEDVILLPLVAQALKKAQDEGYVIAVISNQASVPERKTYEAANGGIVTVIELLRARGVSVDYYDFAEHKDHDRKPNPGMGERLGSELKRMFNGATIDKENSFMVGDATYKKAEIGGYRPDPNDPSKKILITKKDTSFSNSDRLFAANFGIEFKIPADYFGWRKYGVHKIERKYQAFDLYRKLMEPHILDDLSASVELEVGDSGGDGHDKTDSIIIRTNFNKVALKSAYYVGTAVAEFDLIGDFAEEFEDNLLPKKHYEKLVELGYDKDLEFGDSDDEENLEISIEDYFNIYLFMIKLGNPKFSYEIISADSYLDLGGYGLFFF